jgi:hypothetical protein
MLKCFGAFIKLPFFLKFYLHRSLTNEADKIMGGLLSNSGDEKMNQLCFGATNDKEACI